ncbi:Crp/Fnr family transcriptional regulator [Chondrinema litorale]|uniref:Crp/Fnr family transcriptional regulator n=1 Tax=Chondrinema litorale TaxID=2994555 RepID=UPI0025439514|nr:Crp/Fnr family transcriptional regulator [Chondrinema litorale]UZR98100.1 Crp/Fnr family transcriptional regulator [Chondrinema litorale]
MEENPVIQYLKHNGRYPEKDLLMLQDELVFRKLKKDEILLEKGEVCSTFSFLEAGAIVHYDIDSDIYTHVFDVNIPKDWVINHKSFSSRKPSEYTIKAYEESTIYSLSIDSIHKLIGISQVFLQLGKLLDEATSRVEFFDKNYSPDEKYQYILDNKPALLQKFPQRLIAAYLKITPETLSRVRNRFSKS